MPRRSGLRARPTLCAIACALASAQAAADSEGWWDPAWAYRAEITVTTGAVDPDKGYDGYTARLATLDTATLIADGKLQADCDDLRVLFHDDSGGPGNGVWVELDRHLLSCDAAASDLRFALTEDIATSSSDARYYLYYGNPAATAPTALGTTNVYLWFDDASVDRTGSYVRGRGDPWHGTGFDNSFAHSGSAFYTYDNGDNFTSTYRRAVDERDVYAEAEFFHTDCYPLNMTTGIIVRGISTGTGGGESSTHYYASNRGHQASCDGGYSHDGDILEDARTTTAVDGANPPAIVIDQWRRQGLAAFDTGATQLRFYDEDDSADWDALGYPDAGNLQVSGTDASNENTSRGYAGIITAQDQARLRNILIRRYVEPEPALTLAAEQPYPDILVTKRNAGVESDPISNLPVATPNRIPGALVDFEIEVENRRGSPDPGSVQITDSLPPGLAFFVNDVDPVNNLPVLFAEGAVPSNVTIGTIEYSDDDGASFVYSPTAGADGCDPDIDAFRVTMSGTMAPDVGAGSPSFTLTYRACVD